MVEVTAYRSGMVGPRSVPGDAVLASLPDVAFVTDRHGTIAWINDVVTTTLGHHAADIVGTSVLDLVHPAERRDVAASLAAPCSDGIHLPREVRLRAVDGAHRELEVRARTTLHDGEAMVVIVGRETHHRDERQRRMRLLFEHAPAALAIVHPAAPGVDANGPFAALFGYSRDELLHLDPALLVHPDDRAAMAHDRRLLEDGVVTRANAERRYVRADGSVFHGRSAATAMRDVDETIERLVVTVEDVSLQDEARELVARSEARFRALVDYSPDIVAIVRPGGEWEASEQGTRLLGYPKGFDPDGGVLSLVHPDDMERAAVALDEVLSGARSAHEPIEVRLRAADGHYRDFECIGQNLDDDPHLGGIVITARDITRRKAAERALRQAEQRFRIAFERAPLVVSIVDLDGRIVDVNAAGCELLGRRRDDLVGTFADQTVHPHDRTHAIEATTRQIGGDDARAEFRLVRADGTEWWALSHAVLVDDEGGEPYVLTLQADITARKQLENELERQATRDPLTGLRNRAALTDHVESLLARRGDERVTLMFVDLDGFKRVNDTHGHTTGDNVLREIANQLLHAVRTEDAVARLGGDEFVVVCNDGRDVDDARELAQRLREAINAPLDVDGHRVQVDASIGVAIATPRDDVTSLIMRADAAAYRAKHAGRGRVELAFD